MLSRNDKSLVAINIFCWSISTNCCCRSVDPGHS